MTQSASGFVPSQASHVHVVHGLPERVRGVSNGPGPNDRDGSRSAAELGPGIVRLNESGLLLSWGAAAIAKDIGHLPQRR